MNIFRSKAVQVLVFTVVAVCVATPVLLAAIIALVMAA